MEAGNSFGPSEHLLDRHAGGLAESIADVSSGAPIDRRRAPRMNVLGNVWRHAESPCTSDKIPRVVALVGTHSGVAADVFIEHLKSDLALCGAIRSADTLVHQQTMPIFGQCVCHEAELRFLTPALSEYRRALYALDVSDRVGAQLPPGRSDLRRQVERASTSVVANIAEGAGEFRSAEKARFYRMARRSAIEVVAWLDITRQRHEAAPQDINDAMDQYRAVVAMLVRLIQSHSK